MLWAANVFLVGTSRLALCTMISEFTEVLREHSIDWKQEELEYMLCDCNGDPGLAGLGLRVVGPGFEVQVPRKTKVEALGVILTPSMATQQAVDHRLQKARQLFYRDIRFYRSRSAPMKVKMQLYISRVQRSALHAAG